MEWLDIVDENGNPTGKIVERSTAHKEGIRHRTAHVWLMRRNIQTNEIEILLQKRSHKKDSNPDCYDISSAGHIPAGVDFIPSALRELEEELGVKAKAEELHYCGQRKVQFSAYFHGNAFVENQISNVYVLWIDAKKTDFILQESEVEKIQWITFANCMKAVKENTIEHCIAIEELEMIQKYCHL